MELKRVVVAFFCLGIFSCESVPEVSTRPSGILSEDSLIHMLREIHQMEGILSNSGMRQDSAAMLFQVFEMELYKKYAVDSTRFSKSLKYYTSNLKKLDSLYQVLRQENQ